MIKNITLILVLTYLFVSCGKKSDPQYKETLKIKFKDTPTKIV